MHYTRRSLYHVYMYCTPVYTSVTRCFCGTKQRVHILNSYADGVQLAVPMRVLGGAFSGIEFGAQRYARGDPIRAHANAYNS